MMLRIQYISFCFLVFVFVDISASFAQYEEVSEEDCPENDSCVRFCCLNDTRCSNQNYFHLSMIPEASKLNPKYKILKGTPDCGPMFVEDEIKWEFLPVKRFKIISKTLLLIRNFCRTVLFCNTTIEKLLTSITSTVLKITARILCSFALKIKSQMKMMQPPRQI